MPTDLRVTAGLLTQPFQTVAEDIFIWSVGIQIPRLTVLYKSSCLLIYAICIHVLIWLPTNV